MLLSIIIPVYNVERFLRECLDSVFAQTIRDYEVICINDGSTDSSLEILHEYEATHANMVVIDQENQGLGYTRNVGIEQAKGDYIGFVDSDDFVAPEMFENMVRKMQETGAQVAVSNPYIYDSLTKEIYPYRNMLEFYRLSLLGGFSPLENPKVFSFLGAWDKVYLRSLLLENYIRFPVKRIYEDAPFSYKTLASAKTVTVVKESYYFYRKNAGGAITDKEKKSDDFKRDFLSNAWEIKEFLKGCGIYETVQETFLTYLFRDGMFHHSNATTPQFFREFFDGMRELLDGSDNFVIVKMNIKKFIWYNTVLRCRNYKECRKRLSTMVNLPEIATTDMYEQEDTAE